MRRYFRLSALITAAALLLPLLFAVPTTAAANASPMLAAGSYHALELSSDGAVRSWGSNRYGQLGDGSTEQRAMPTQVMNGAVQVAAGSWSSYALGADGTLYSWGSGEQGQLGLGDTQNRLKPTRVMGDVKQVAAALNRAYALGTDGTLYAWGNASWAYPDGERLTRSPRAVATGVDAVFCGGSTTLLLRDGRLYALGSAAKDSVKNGRASAVLIASNVTRAAATTAEILYIDNLGRLYEYINGSSKLLLGSVQTVSASGGRFAAISSSGALYTWGTNTAGALGHGDLNSVGLPTVALHGISAVAIGSDFAAAVKQNGELWTSGSNAMCQLASGLNRLDYNAFHQARAGGYTLGELGYGEYRVLLDGERLSFDVPPVNRSGRLLVPMRAIFEALGARVSWDGATSTATASKSGHTVSVTIGSTTAYVDGSPVELDAPAEKIDWRTLVPLRFVATALGARVDYFGSERLCEIRSTDAPTAPSADLLAGLSAGISVELGGAQGSASGVVVHPDGLIVTNRHVAEHARSITVTVGGRRYAASTVYLSESTDFAILKVAAHGLYAAELSPNLPNVGERLTVYDGSTGLATSCRVTGHGYGGESLLVDASLSPGASGSGAYDSHGRLAGLVWAAAGTNRVAILPASEFAAAVAEAVAGL